MSGWVERIAFAKDYPTDFEWRAILTRLEEHGGCEYETRTVQNLRLIVDCLRAISPNANSTK